MKRIACLLFAFLPILGYSQGCSDSGFCTMGALKPDQFYSKIFRIRLNSIELTQHIGTTKYGDWIHSTFVDANVGITRKMNVQVRLPAYTIIQGNMPTTRGWGDLYINVSQNIIAKEKFQLNATAGVKIYTSQPDKSSSDGLPMPLYQQTSYGSNDINFGASVITQHWMFAVGYQRALNQITNQFSAQRWVGHTNYNTVRVYDASNGLMRGDDVMIRVERNFRLSRFNFHVGALQLWRVNQDRIIAENGNMQSVAGSNGLTLNAVIGGGYQFNASMGIRLITSFKLREREVNSDGLSRDFIGQVAYIIRF